MGPRNLKEHSEIQKGTDITVTFTNFLKGTFLKIVNKKKKRKKKEFSRLTIRCEIDQQKLLKEFSTKRRRQNPKVKKIQEKKGKVIQTRTCAGFT